MFCDLLRSPVTSRSNCVKQRSTFNVSQPCDLADRKLLPQMHPSDDVK